MIGTPARTIRAQGSDARSAAVAMCTSSSKTTFDRKCESSNEKGDCVGSAMTSRVEWIVLPDFAEPQSTLQNALPQLNWSTNLECLLGVQCRNYIKSIISASCIRFAK